MNTSKTLYEIEVALAKSSYFNIYFVGDDTSSYFGSSFEKYFENINDLEEFLLYFNNVCKDNNVSLKELNIL